MARVIVGLLVVLLTSVAAWAQGPADSWDNLNQLRAGQKIEVVDMNLKSLKGTFVSVSEEAIALRVGKDEVAIPRTDVFRVSSREELKRMRNTLIGMGIGTAGGLAAGAWAGYTYHEGEKMGRIMLVTVALGAGAGALVGAAIPTGQKKTVYRAQESRKSPAP